MSSIWWKASEADWGWSLLSLWNGLLSVSHHLTWEMQMTIYLELFRQCFQRLGSSWCYTESARVLWHCRSDLCCVLGHYQFLNLCILWCNCVALHKILNTSLLWFLCRRQHVGSTRLSLHWVIHLREDQGPQCVSNFRRSGQQSKMRLTK
jgi:hypothetical protein